MSFELETLSCSVLKFSIPSLIFIYLIYFQKEKKKKHFLDHLQFILLIYSIQKSIYFILFPSLFIF